ncbi:MAG: nucleotidyltransferase domain-containing protein [Lachnospiraceae bacterium]|nr:nucleotidyltransferase domain-containing protein [Lachnospiraceae bacterium]
MNDEYEANETGESQHRWRTFKEIEMDKVRTFNVIDRKYLSVLNIDKIHPLKQRKVYELVSNNDLDFIKRIWIYGSSTNNCCNVRSDVDVLVEIKEKTGMDYEDIVNAIHKNFVKSLGSDLDISILNYLDKKKQFYKNVLKTRRLVYERND